MYSKIAVEFLLVITVSTAVFAASVSSRQTGAVDSELNIMQKVYDDCESKQDFTECLKGKALTAISRAVEQVCEQK